MKVLVVKTSSLGDVVHTLPAVTDASKRGFQIDWVVEEAFSEIARMHPGVSVVIPIAWRRWRKSLYRSMGEIRSFKQDLIQCRYDIAVDSQGLIKSGLIGCLADGESRAGFNFNSAREPVTSFLYDKKYEVARGRHAIDRQRELFSQALGYRLTGGADSNIEQKCDLKRQVFLLHGTSKPAKEWPLERWIKLAEIARFENYEVFLSWGNDEERKVARQVADKCDSKLVPKTTLNNLLPHLRESQIVVGVDTGLTHLSAAIGSATLGLYGPTNVDLTGCRGRFARTLSSDSGMGSISAAAAWDSACQLMEDRLNKIG